MQSFALTFDDGPDPEITPAVLDQLAQAGATASFFPIAPRAEHHPELIERMLADGHTVGLHCDEHARHSTHSAEWLRRDTDRALKRLAALGVTPKLWRTPWGDTAEWTATIAEQHGLELVGWTADTRDWRGDRAADMFAALRAQLVDGAIVLAHDGIGPGARRSGGEQTVEFTRLAVGHAEAEGLSVKSLT